MLPTLFKVGPFTAHSMGIMMAIGVLFGLFVSWKKAKESHVDDNRFFDVAFLTLFWGLVGARVGYILMHFGEFGMNPLKWVWLTNYVGLSFWGALVGVVSFLIVRLWKGEEDLFLWLDYLSLGMLAGIPWGFLAAFLNGSYMGMEVDGFWGLRFPGYDRGVLPIQIVMMLVYVVFFVWWWRMEGEYRMLSWYRAGRVAAKTGFLWFGFLIFVGFSFGLASFFRGEQALVFGVSVDLIGSVVCGVVGVVGLYRRSGRRLRDDLRRKKTGVDKRRETSRASKIGRGVVN